MLAVAHGSAKVVLDGAAGLVRVQAPAGAAGADDLSLTSLFHVECELDGHPAARVSLNFDALGIGRFANHTLRCHRNGAEARLTLSSYGRPRRW
jgi:hypothetical protein